MCGTGRLGTPDLAKRTDGVVKGLDPQFPGVFIKEAKKLDQKQKNKVAAYLGAYTHHEYLELFDNPARKPIVEYFREQKKGQFGPVRPKDVKDQGVWRPVASVWNHWTPCLEKLKSSTKKDWIMSIAKGDVKEVLPLKTYPPGFMFLNSASYDEA